ncbi:multiple sugar transport system permease protein [Rathayibacter oskolensis]|uniref:Multiple sugar transport system permease protein n=1 Tax=Rathayibacter oskolensis TaxID=1891671 RepID=A0A1X7N9U3_9MICO|nr:sugar ABC transporter permease [Rathayibacter oskolensis]SMH33634.1 multiple sugar transport system permease protein [Rathayibacter oskolensis]
MTDVTLVTTDEVGTPAVPAKLDRHRPRPRRSSLRSRTAPYFFSAPAMILYLAFTVVPLFYALGTSFFAQRLTGGGILGTKESVFVWFENYAKVFTDASLVAGLGRLAIYGLIAVPLTLGLALLFALLLDAQGTRFTRFGRTAIFIPYAVPGVVAALMWGFMYLPSTSPFSYVTRSLGLGSIPFLEQEGLYGSIANITIWGGIGFNMLVIYTALRSIPNELVEAARIDGASETQIALRVKVPLVGPALILTAIFALLGALQLYGEPAMLMPLTNTISTTWAPLMSIYRDAFVLDNLSSASASSMILAIGTAAVSLAVLAVVRRLSRRGMA